MFLPKKKGIMYYWKKSGKNTLDFNSLFLMLSQSKFSFKSPCILFHSVIHFYFINFCFFFLFSYFFFPLKNFFFPLTMIFIFLCRHSSLPIWFQCRDLVSLIDFAMIFLILSFFYFLLLKKLFPFYIFHFLTKSSQKKKKQKRNRKENCEKTILD